MLNVSLLSSKNFLWRVLAAMFGVLILLSLSIPLAEAEEEEPLITFGLHNKIVFDESGDGNSELRTEIFMKHDEKIDDAYNCVSRNTYYDELKEKNIIETDAVRSECPDFVESSDQEIVDYYNNYSEIYSFPTFSCTIIARGNYFENTFELDKESSECGPEMYQMFSEGLENPSDEDKFQASEGGYKFTIDFGKDLLGMQDFLSEIEGYKEMVKVEFVLTITMPTKITNVDGSGINWEPRGKDGRTAYIEITDDTVGQVVVTSEPEGHPVFDSIWGFVGAVLTSIISTLIIAVVSKMSKKTKVNKNESKQILSPTGDLTLASSATLVGPLSAGATPAQSLPQAYQLEQFNQGQNQAPSDTSSTWTQPMMPPMTQPMMPPMQTQQTTYKHPQENKILALTILGAFFYLPAPFAWAKAHRAKKEMRAMNLQPSQNIKVCSIISMVYTSFIPICIIFILKLLLAFDSSTDSAMVLFYTISPLLLHI